jgi:hypothetical protein
MYYLGYGLVVVIGAFFVYYFVIGGRLVLAQEIAQFIVVFGFFIIIFLLGFISGKKKVKRAQDEGNLDDQIVRIDSQLQLYDKIVSVFLGVIILAVALYDGSFDIIDFAQIVISVPLLLGWRSYLFRSKRLEPYNTIASLNYLDYLRDALVVVILPILILLIPALGRDFSTTEIIQAVSVFVVAYAWHKYLFSRKK